MKMEKENLLLFILILQLIWFNSGWEIESIDGEYVNISIYIPLSSSSYINLPNKSRNSKKV